MKKQRNKTNKQKRSKFTEIRKNLQPNKCKRNKETNKQAKKKYTKMKKQRNKTNKQINKKGV